MIVINNKYEIGDRVYLVSDPEQLLRLVTSIIVFKGGELLYGIACGVGESKHYDFELSAERDLTFSS